jgi:hypothetical protein
MPSVHTEALAVIVRALELKFQDEGGALPAGLASLPSRSVLVPFRLSDLVSDQKPDASLKPEQR